MTQFLRQWLAALRRFTRLPIGPAGLEGPDGVPPAASLPHWPGVGLVVGLAACVAFALVSIGLPDSNASGLAAALACTLVGVLLTGGAEEAALARTLDGGAPHPGPAGMLAVLLVVVGKLALLAVLADISGVGVLSALLAGHAVSRFWPLLQDKPLPALPAPDAETVDSATSEAAPAAAAADRGTPQVAALWCAVPLLLMVLADGLDFALVSLVFSGFGWWGARRWLPRVSGQERGATQQVCELAFLLGAAFSVGY